MKLIRLFSQNIFLFFTLFLFAFIPLFPKIPLIGLTHVNVYIRAEDFIVLFFVLIYLLQVIRRRESLKTPLTIAILAFWVSGFISTLLGVIFIFPHLNDPTITGDPRIYTRNAFLFYARHIEYMSLFFIACAAIKNKKNIKIIVPVIIGVFLTTVLYGFGQRFIPQKFPAFSTMNEEFAKGIPLVLDAAGRIQSTFAGHYDFSAFLVLIIPLVGSLIFGYKNWFARIGLLAIDLLAFLALLMTQSRTSFVMYLLAVIFMLILQKQKKWIIPVIIISFIMLRTFTGLYTRYAATLSSVNRIVDARTGKVIGYGDNIDGKIVINNVQPSGHDLYAGSLSTSGKKIGSARSITVKTQKGNEKSTSVQNIKGDFIIQKASALDASITTRLQAEWPNAIRAFQRNVLFGSGYSSITLATDGNYFRFLGETGLLGFGIFGLIFLIYSIYAAKIIPKIDDSLSKSFVIGVAAGIFGLGLNATLIDVFEASKIAYVLWILVGISIGIMVHYRKNTINIVHEIRKVLMSMPAIILYLGVSSLLFFWPMLNNFFVADDFTWLRWVDCVNLMQTGIEDCSNKINVLTYYFTSSADFFYRPGMKAYFYFLYNSQFGGISPVMYHLTSLALHAGVTIFIFLMSFRFLKDKFFAFLTAFIFLLLASHSETLYWISAAGHLFASFFTVLALWFYMKWSDRKNIFYLSLSILSSFLAPLFHEYGIIAPLLVVIFGVISARINQRKNDARLRQYILYAFPVVVYFFLKIISHSFWASGDYSYNLSKLPYNIFGNLGGVLGFVFIGSNFLGWYQIVRDNARNNLPIAAVFIALSISVLALVYKKIYKGLKLSDREIILVSIVLFVTPLLPFLPLGNIAPRYTYLASFGAVLFAVFILQKIFIRLSGINRYFALGAVILFTSIFITHQVRQLQKENGDWQYSGRITNNFMEYMNYGYENLRLGYIKKPVFYFVNVPQRYETAWVFPVGIDDAAWFAYRENKLTTHSLSSLDEATMLSTRQKNARVFIFDKDGNIRIVR